MGSASSTKPLLVIITGPPCSGKTTLATQLSGQTGLACISKDTIKESLFDSLGWKDAEWSHRLSQVTYNIQFHLADQILASGTSLILEGTFQGPEHRDRLLNLHQRHPGKLIQVQCGADGVVLTRRFLERWHAGKRHPGHVDPQIFPSLEPILQAGWYVSLDLPGRIFYIDATDFHAPTWIEQVDQLFQELTSNENRVTHTPGDPIQ